MLIERRPAGIFKVASVPTGSCSSPLRRPPSRLSTLIAEEYFPFAEVTTAGTLRGSRTRRERRWRTKSRSRMDAVVAAMSHEIAFRYGIEGLELKDLCVQT